ncbi:hypothetical protein HZS55_07705 [Halosimplex rubrum]|uniref:Uncharacterized protein n=1 Tax=Halosimplex rubrum TaxID=869889 RepID=A0A7D5P496_9EURY|nr:hypothetical protein [Halosimplex rubrum]QLH77185.1 hypothetical protein HZS55_07705 [Halosimplex rubrum]
MTEDSDLYTPAQYVEHLHGHGHRDPVADPHAGTVQDPQLSRYLSVMRMHYDPREADEPAEMPGQARDLQEWRDITGIEATDAGRHAIEEGDMQTLKLQTGDQGQQADISGMKAIQKLDEIIEDPAPVIVILGDMGTGKTDLGGLIGQRAKHLLGIEKVASNIPTLRETDQWTDQEGEPRDGFVPGFRSFEEWVEQDGDPLDQQQSPKMFIGDEFSSGGDGTGRSGYFMRTKMGPLVFKIRKYNGILIYIAHDPSSIHPLLWRVGYIIQKQSKKQAVVADRIKSGEVRDELFRIDGIPQTDWRYDTKDPATWSWTGAEDEENPEPGEVAYDVAVWTVRACKEDGLSHRETAKYVPFGKSWVGNRAPEIADGEHDGALDRVEGIIA